MTEEDKALTERLAREVMGWSGTFEGRVAPAGWHPLDDWQYAASVLARMEELGWWGRIETPHLLGASWWAKFCPHSTTARDGRMDYVAGASSGPRAICLAALATMDAQKAKEA